MLIRVLTVVVVFTRPGLTHTVTSAVWHCCIVALLCSVLLDRGVGGIRSREYVINMHMKFQRTVFFFQVWLTHTRPEKV